MVFVWKKSDQYFYICKFSAFNAYGLISLWYDVISFLLGGFSLEKDHNSQYFTSDSIEVIFDKAHPNFPLALDIDIKCYIIYLTLLTTVQTRKMGYSKSNIDFN